MGRGRGDAVEMRGGEVSWRGDAVERRVARGDEGPLPPDALLLVPGERKKGGREERCSGHEGQRIERLRGVTW